MGIPKFFKWLTARYPMVLENVERLQDIPPFDNFYLDLNGVFHKCFHGNSQQKLLETSKQANFDSLWVEVMAMIDELVHIIKPRKVLVLAIDGVTPRAKLCQQRARRFRAMRDRQAMITNLLKEGELDEDDTLADSNMITAGSWFMTEVSKQIKYFLDLKMNTDPLYQPLKIIYSDAGVPGEGEHKIMDFLRTFRSDPAYEPNTRHCIYGADADLIMLSLATHEPHFVILRQKVEVRKKKAGKVERTKMIVTQDFQLLYVSLLREYLYLDFKEVVVPFKWDLERVIDDFIFICFFVGNDFLPSLLSLDISIGSLNMLIDIYKEVLPELDGYITSEGEINWKRAARIIRLIGLSEPKAMKMRMSSIEHIDYIAKGPSGNALGSVEAALVEQRVKIDNLKLFKKKKKYEKLRSDGKLKDYLFVLKQNKRVAQNKDISSDEEDVKEEEEPQTEEEKNTAKFLKNAAGYVPPPKKEKVIESYFNPEDIPDSDISDCGEVNELEEMKKMEEALPQNIPMLQSEAGRAVISTQVNEISEEFKQNKDFFSEFCEVYATDPEAAKALYYEKKLDIKVQDEEGQQKLNKLLFTYLEGLQWVLFYYFRGPPHWGWFYPYHYPPMITDFNDLESIIRKANKVQNGSAGEEKGEEIPKDLKISFNFQDPDNGPFQPLLSLFCLMPPTSIDLLPACFRKAHEAESPLIDLFPSSIEIDLNGRSLPWEAISLTPFVEAKRVRPFYAQLLEKHGADFTAIQKERNTFHSEIIMEFKADHINSAGIPCINSCFKYPDIKAEDNHIVESYPQEVKNPLDIDFKPRIQVPLKAQLLQKEKLEQPCVDLHSLRHLKMLDTYKIKATEQGRKVNSKTEITVQIEVDPNQETKEITGYLDLLDRDKLKARIFTGFPGRRESRLVRIITQQVEYSVQRDSHGYFFLKNENIEKDAYDRAYNLAKRAARRKGIEVRGSISVVTYHKLKGFKREPRGGVFKIYEREEHFAFLSLVSLARDKRHFQNLDHLLANPQKAFQINGECLLLDERTLGLRAKINAVRPGHHYSMTIKTHQDGVQKFANHTFGHQVMQTEWPQFEPKFWSLDDLAQELHQKYKVLAMLTSSVMVGLQGVPGFDEQQTNLGLQLKSKTSKVQIADYVFYEPSSNSYQFHETVKKIIEEYKEKFPEVFRAIRMKMQRERESDQSKLHITDLYPEVEKAPQRVEAIQNWLRAQVTSKCQFVPLGMYTLPSKVINSMVELEVPLEYTYNPDGFIEVDSYYCFCEQKPFWVAYDETQQFDLGDRVINIRSGDRRYIPFGLFGTVIGYSEEHIIVLFDSPLILGYELASISQSRSYRIVSVEKNRLVNYSRRSFAIDQGMYAAEYGQETREWGGRGGGYQKAQSHVPASQQHWQQQQPQQKKGYMDKQGFQYKLNVKAPPYSGGKKWQKK